ncbi:MAG: lysine biosynthesis protein LysW [Chloroflexi bacterium]|nr:lysine biosynthesis protein LysW [Chloroflexota bacterium]
MATATVECPECGAELQLDEGSIKGEIISCSDCGVDLEIISVKPPKVELAPEEEEDWGE